MRYSAPPLGALRGRRPVARPFHDDHIVHDHVVDEESVEPTSPKSFSTFGEGLEGAIAFIAEGPVMEPGSEQVGSTFGAFALGAALYAAILLIAF